jgi:hypothetical protein
MIKTLVAGSLVFVGAGFIIWAARPGAAVREPNGDVDAHPKIDVVATLIAPKPIEGEIVIGEPNAPTELTYELENRCAATLSELRAELQCQCSLTRKLPERIAPGETVRVSFRFRAPEAGTSHETVSVFSSGGSNLIAVLHPSIRVRQRAPRVTYCPENVRLSGVRGETITSELLIQSVEEKEQPPGIRSLGIASDVTLRQRLLEAATRPAQDPAFVSRAYRFELSLDAATEVENDLNGEILVQFDSDAGPPRRIPLHIHRLAFLEVAPARIAFSETAISSGKNRRVAVIDRSGASDRQIVAEFDESLVAVKRANPDSAKAALFDITPRALPSEERATQVRFRSGSEVAVLAIEMQSMKLASEQSR